MQLKVSGSLSLKGSTGSGGQSAAWAFCSWTRVKEKRLQLGMGKAAATRGQPHFENPSRPNGAAVPEGFVGEMHSVVVDEQHVGG